MADSDEGSVEIPLTETETLKCWPLLISEERGLEGGAALESHFDIPEGTPLKRYVVILAEVR